MAFNVAIVGHSFVRRFNDGLKRTRRTSAQQLGVNNSVRSIYISGKGGAMADQILSNYAPASTNILILDLGTNDLCGSFDGATLAEKVTQYLEEYIERYPNLKLIYIFEIVERLRTRNISKKEFDYERFIYNKKMSELASRSSIIYFRKQEGLTCIKQWSNDGIHPNTAYGSNQYMMNIRRTIMEGVRRMNKVRAPRAKIFERLRFHNY